MGAGGSVAYSQRPVSDRDSMADAGIVSAVVSLTLVVAATRTHVVVQMEGGMRTQVLASGQWRRAPLLLHGGSANIPAVIKVL